MSLILNISKNILRREEEIGSLEFGRVGLVWVLRVGRIFQVGRCESDKVVWSSLTDGWVDRCADLGRFGNIDRSGEVLEEGLLVD